MITASDVGERQLKGLEDGADMQLGTADAGANKFYYAGADYPLTDALTAQYY